MKTAIQLAGLLAASCLPAIAEWSVGRGAITLETNLTGVYDSNTNASVNNISDYHLSLEPTLRYRRVNARVNTNASASVNFRRYRDEPGANSNDADLRLNWTLDRTEGATTGAELDLAYFEDSDADLEVNRRVRSRNLVASLSGEVLIARRSLIDAGFTHRDSKRDFASDQRSTNARLGYRYLSFTEGTSLHVGYTHHRSRSTDHFSDDTRLDQTSKSLAATFSRTLYADLDGSVTAGYRWLERGSDETALGLDNHQGAFIGLNLTGAFLPRRHFPKTTGTFHIGYEQAETPGLNDNSSERLVGQINLTWQARERTTVSFEARRSQDLSIDDRTIVSTGASLGLTQEIGHFTTADLHLGFTRAEFADALRTDDRINFNAGVTRRINRTWSTRLGYDFLDSNSTAVVANYRRHLVMLTLTHAF